MTTADRHITRDLKRHKHNRHALVKSVGIGSVVFDSHEVLAYLGKGAAGHVFKCRNLLNGNSIEALKLYPASIANNPVVNARLGREMRALYAVQHPNVTHFYECYRNDSFIGIAMQYIEGSSLESAIVHDGPMRAQTAAMELFLQITRGLRAIHDQGVLPQTELEFSFAGVSITKRRRIL